MKYGQEKRPQSILGLAGIVTDPTAPQTHNPESIYTSGPLLMIFVA